MEREYDDFMIGPQSDENEDHFSHIFERDSDILAEFDDEHDPDDLCGDWEPADNDDGDSDDEDWD